MLLPVRRTTYHVPSAPDVSAQDIRAIDDMEELTATLGPPSTSSENERLLLYRLTATIEWDDIADARNQSGIAVRTTEVLLLYSMDADRRIAQRLTYRCEEDANAICAMTPEDAMRALEAELPDRSSGFEQPFRGGRR